MIGYLIGGILIGTVLGYAFFYFRYLDVHQVDGVRKNLQSEQDRVKTLQLDNNELTLQNSLLKDKTSDLLKQNNDYRKLVSELSRYYFHIKEASSKVSELSDLLKVFDTDIENKINVLPDASSIHPEPLRTVDKKESTSMTKEIF